MDARRAEDEHSRFVQCLGAQQLPGLGSSLSKTGSGNLRAVVVAHMIQQGVEMVEQEETIAVGAGERVKGSGEWWGLGRLGSQMSRVASRQVESLVHFVTVRISTVVAGADRRGACSRVEVKTTQRQGLWSKASVPWRG